MLLMEHKLARAWIMLCSIDTNTSNFIHYTCTYKHISIWHTTQLMHQGCLDQSSNLNVCEYSDIVISGWYGSIEGVCKWIRQMKLVHVIEVSIKWLLNQSPTCWHNMFVVALPWFITRMLGFSHLAQPFS